MAKILVIDDDAIVRDALTIILEQLGHEVLSAADGNNGVVTFRRNKPDLVILDRDLPGLTGSKVLAKIREESRSAVVLILSGYDGTDAMKAYLEKGAAAFLSKGEGLAPVLEEVARFFPHPATAVPSRAAASPAAAPRTPKVLIADDEAEIRGMLRKFLVPRDYDVLEATNGNEALARAAAENPDLLLLDIDMPGKDGLTVLKELKARRPEIDAIMVTGNDDEEVARECLKNGAFDYIPKPICFHTLEMVLKVWRLTRGRVQKLP
ncbi:MAG: hypothetical protein A2X32_01990 [Elusimicrobia bacterium GWC2_64_44]|nr:MAG: hypothetical protein A2X32_01990 [Elusimicrobia bacterium GWC2_64_44]